MLQQVLEYIHNYFIRTAKVDTFEIKNGMVSLPFLQDGQRFWINNSILNNGVYTYHTLKIENADGSVTYQADTIMNDDDTEAAGLQDETFTGTICALAVPPSVIALSAEINGWVENYGANAQTPYQSENVIGVYGYTKATGGSGAGGAVTWQDVYGSRLNRWRRVAF